MICLGELRIRDTKSVWRSRVRAGGAHALFPWFLRFCATLRQWPTRITATASDSLASFLWRTAVKMVPTQLVHDMVLRSGPEGFSGASAVGGSVTVLRPEERPGPVWETKRQSEIFSQAFETVGRYVR